MERALPAPLAALGRQRLVVVGGLAAVVAVSWAYLFWVADGMASVTCPMHAGLGSTVAMWVAMMSAMMLPTAAPMIVMHARFQGGRLPHRSPAPFTGLFALGYGVAWTGYAVIAAGLQRALENAAVMNPMAMALTSARAGGGVLIGAGLFQLSPFKDACLRQCRSPIGFFMTAWRDGRRGAFAMGLHHGSFCVGCCWALMAVMFVVGTMNMLWVALLTAFMLLEKIGPRPKLITGTTGLALIAGGVALAV